MDRTVYVTQEGCTVRRHGEQLHVNVGGRKVAEVPMHDVGQLVLVGNAIVTPSAMDLLLERGVDTVFLTVHGRFRARLTHSQSSNIHLRLAQYRTLTNPDSALSAAASIVAGKLSNARAPVAPRQAPRARPARASQGVPNAGHHGSARAARA